ncbi:hypothetical protein [Nocardia sp. CA-120079]|uniref:hypothetical protein n=1 Tax=Nocardia sp. CA-120079 TaxID=3239974 RepID=UPI003D989773
MSRSKSQSYMPLSAETSDMAHTQTELFRSILRRFEDTHWEVMSPEQRLLLMQLLSQRVTHDSSASLFTGQASTNSSWNRVNQLVEFLDEAVKYDQEIRAKENDFADAPDLFVSSPVVVPDSWFEEFKQYRAGAEIELPWAED